MAAENAAWPATAEAALTADYNAEMIAHIARHPRVRDLALFVGSPVWIQIAFGEPPRHALEVPSHRPSDTWAGPNTREGIACYASRTAAQVEFERGRPRLRQ